MEEKPPRFHLKRPFFEDDDSNKPPSQKRVRFPKGKKVKPGEEAVKRVDVVEDSSGDLNDPRLAAKERSKRRNQMTAELFTEDDGRGMVNDISAVEVSYEENENFIDDGIQLEPFNLDKEREEGYFDADGNFVEYVNENEIKDAWLDSVDSNVKYTRKTSATTNGEDNEVVAQDLSTQDIGIITRRIANVLEPGETVLQALRRLKGSSNNRKEKMSAETKLVFDQLTEDAMKLMENGDYNVYHEMQEVFQREAEGYEKLALARGKSIYANVGLENSDPNLGSDMPTDINNLGVTSSIIPDSAVGTSNSSVTAAEISSNSADDFDMFADDENLNSSSEANNIAVIQSSSEAGDVQNDYVYDETSGYYYSGTLGYYYDPSTGLYCSAASGQWYSFNEATGTYDEVKEVASSTT